MISDTAPATDSLTVHAGEQLPLHCRELERGGVRATCTDTNVYQISDMVVRLAIGVTDGEV